MTTRRWIIGKDGRRCGERNCIGYDKANAQIVSIGEDGHVRTKCRECGAPHEYKSREYKERRACQGCAHVRDVTVKVWHDGRTSARPFCAACEADQSAASHIETARHLREKARKIRAARRVQSTTATTEPTS
jgi:hypothetical protein